jgi:F-type H+-transporting ATPase subunit b
MLDAITFLAAASEEEGGSFLVEPGLGLMLWTLLAFGATLYILNKLAFPKISEQLDKRQRAIEESIDSAERTKAESEEILAEYRERLREARTQAEEIVARSRKASEQLHEESLQQARVQREELMDQTRRDIEAEKRRALQEIRSQVADLTVLATEKVTRKTLDEHDQRRLVEDALSELDFEALAAGSDGPGGSRN